MKITGKIKKIIFVVFVIVFLCPIIWLSFKSFPEFLNGVFSMTWPKTHGIVISKSISEKAAWKKGIWRPVVKYTYSVKNKEYTNEKISFSVFFYGKQWAADIISRYELHRNVDVFYNPNNHTISCLRTGPEIAATVYSILGLGVILYLGCLLIRHFLN